MRIIMVLLDFCTALGVFVVLIGVLIAGFVAADLIQMRREEQGDLNKWNRNSR